MPRPQSAGSDYEEPSEEALLGQEYKRLKRSYRVLENDYKAYKEDTRRKLDKQKFVQRPRICFYGLCVHVFHAFVLRFNL